MVKKSMPRTASIERTTCETSIEMKLNLDAPLAGPIDTGVGFMDHMLTLMSRHGMFGLEVKASGDTAVDDHHSVEDLGICMGEVLRQALGDKAGIHRYGSVSIPMHEALVRIDLDFSGRPHLVYHVDLPKAKVGTFDVELVEEFLVGLCNHAGVNMHVNLEYGSNLHHIVEAIFKALGRALGQAVAQDPRVDGVMSTKGRLE
ncbi:MAG: imidazoleglycerol-phosphate dehydratase HisB [Desulfuromonadaceae bacterium]|nr:imidazoleglycerol-phosphate dehydratase HisB [Desulfuromonadaceae bacterium]